MSVGRLSGMSGGVRSRRSDGNGRTRHLALACAGSIARAHAALTQHPPAHSPPYSPGAGAWGGPLASCGPCWRAPMLRWAWRALIVVR